MTPTPQALRAGRWNLGLDHPRLIHRRGRGVSIAVIDSGVHAHHPHIGRLAGGIAIRDDGTVEGDLVDRLGHGTAITAAIQEKAPEAEIHIVKVFHDTLSTNVEALVQAIDWAVSGGVRLINLSLGTANPRNERLLSEAIARGRVCGTIVVSAGVHRGNVWYPGSLADVVGVGLAGDCPRHRVWFEELEHCVARASGFARPIPGVPPARNLNGVSFSVANTTGVLARILEDAPHLRGADDLFSWLRGAFP
jgi:hypothetical protein